ncbi:hypothetical protein LAV72_00755 [Lysinibacillus xylanilyticus]|uniref:hypothetical protein n=1 Tax=Lysinibacillus xylanilyticus TaxID=582475 RepID=UPI002B252B44|nr:hypothetical protein [Lysinibacillus xylanilyticus]MEB2298154.1 hypothetical protein [Lysinibacillus xylanilyticus]
MASLSLEVENIPSDFTPFSTVYAEKKLMHLFNRTIKNLKIVKLCISTKGRLYLKLEIQKKASR